MLPHHTSSRNLLFYSILLTQSIVIKMAPKSLITLFFLVVVAVIAVSAFTDLDDEEDNEFDLEFMKRDPAITDMLYAEKRGKKMRKYKSCVVYGQDCQCSRRTGRVALCYGAGGQNGVGQ